ncbi:pentapeptide repeat-containing protein [Christiangramia sp. SM2212]|uniref:Pentapeptide repeat-containing protein n=1 Tax=Christiangramia sediminicola TaxID=3073267 RepID=A0ABU1ETA4_9FLAO|nr:pentapeptide repeat-containing protein [Christiangramia sp. SM2212]MDR5591212.1 pentapeptide repeat-containing protein [Christiangramia sp. SM2212]
MIGSIVSYGLFQDDLALWAYGNSQSRNGELLKDFLSVLGGLFILSGLYISYIRARDFEKSVRNQDEQIKNQTTEIKLNREALINDQFKNAVQHLGSDKEPIVLGGIAELHTLAKNNENLSELICDILCSFIRSAAEQSIDIENINYTLVTKVIDTVFHSPIFNGFQKNIQNCNLSGLELKECHVENISFKDCILFKTVDSVSFTECNFENSIIQRGTYSFVQFHNSSLDGIACMLSSFYQVEFGGAEDSNFLNCKFSFCKFKGYISRSWLLFCYFENCDFHPDYSSSYSFVEKINFSGSQFFQVVFNYRKMELCQFEICDFENVIFEKYIGRSSFRGSIKSAKRFTYFNENKILSRINKVTNLDGIEFKDFSHSGLDKAQFDIENARILARNFNDLIEFYGFGLKKIKDTMLTMK